MIPYMVGKLAPNSTHVIRGLVKQGPGRGYFRVVPFQIGDKFVTSPHPLIVELEHLLRCLRDSFSPLLCLTSPCHVFLSQP